MRIIVMLLVYIICFVSPQLIDFISLSGALFNSTLGFILPVIIHNKYFGERGRLSASKKALNTTVLLVGGAFSLMAVIESTMDMLGLRKNAAR